MRLKLPSSSGATDIARTINAALALGASYQPGKHAKQPLEKQNSPLSCASGMSMIYLGRNLPSVLISLKETVTKIATGCSKISQLPCAATFPSFPFVLDPDFYPASASTSLAPIPQQMVAMFLHRAEIRITVGRLLIQQRSREPRWHRLLGQESNSQLGPGRELPGTGKERLFGRQGRSQLPQTAHPAKQPGLQISGSRIRITICWHRHYWLGIICETLSELGRGGGGNGPTTRKPPKHNSLSSVRSCTNSPTQPGTKSWIEASAWLSFTGQNQRSLLTGGRAGLHKGGCHLLGLSGAVHVSLSVPQL